MTTSHIYTADSYEPTRENKKIYAAILQWISAGLQWGTVRNVNIPVLPMSIICVGSLT